MTHSGAKMNSKVESSDSDLRSFVSQFNRERERERERERDRPGAGGRRRSATVKKALK